MSSLAWPLRFARLNLGLALMGLGIAVMVRAGIGLGPVEVLGQGVARQTGLSIGQAIQLSGLVVVAACYLLLRYRPGLGTILNMVLVGLWVDLFLAGAWLPAARGPLGGVGQFAIGTVVMAAASGLYLTARLGAGPNDSLMMGLARTFGFSIRRVRTAIEAIMVLVGWLLGGSVGLGTILFVLAIGPLVQMFLRVFGRGARAGAG